jgi:hypothetical protein
MPRTPDHPCSQGALYGQNFAEMSSIQDNACTCCHANAASAGGSARQRGPCHGSDRQRGRHALPAYSRAAHQRAHCAGRLPSCRRPCHFCRLFASFMGFPQGDTFAVKACVQGQLLHCSDQTEAPALHLRVRKAPDRCAACAVWPLRDEHNRGD